MRSVLLFSAVALAASGFQWSAPTATGTEKQTGVQPASVRVLLPGTHAKLTINGKVVPAKRAIRRFVTPPLQQGQNYTYTFQAEFVRGQKTMTIAQTVKLHAGQKKVVSLRWPATSSTYGASSRTPSRGRTYYYRFTPDSVGIARLYPFREMRADEDSVND